MCNETKLYKITYSEEFIHELEDIGASFLLRYVGSYGEYRIIDVCMHESDAMALKLKYNFTSIKTIDENEYVFKNLLKIANKETIEQYYATF